jgi:hypothetical protein
MWLNSKVYKCEALDPVPSMGRGWRGEKEKELNLGSV